MRYCWLVNLIWGTLLLVVSSAQASPPYYFEDATLRAVQFTPDGKRGWVAGDEGVVWHTRDGGQSWHRQTTGVRASLRSICFITPTVGWIVGREEKPGGGSVGVVLFTNNGGEEWQRAFVNQFPGLNRVRFLTGKTGFLLGDGTPRFPTGIFQTTDGGQSWRVVSGPRAPTWYDGDFVDEATGALAGAWNYLGTLKQGTVTAADVDTLGGRNVRSMRLLEEKAIAVGDGGLVLVSRTGGARWGYADLNLPDEVLANLDFHAVDSVGNQVWVVGRPGSVILYSPDQGSTWKVRSTNQPLPLYALYFVDNQKGWAVGALGTILNTEDGGRTWKTQRSGGQRLSALFLHADSRSLPVETVVHLGLEGGFLTTGVCVTCPDPKSAPFELSTSEQKFAAVMRQAGGVHGEMLWQYPVPQLLQSSNRKALLAYWNKQHDKKAAEQMLRQLVLALRIWRPDVVISDHPQPGKSEGDGGALVAEGLHEAITLAANPKAFPEQLKELGLQPWAVSKSYALWDKASQSHVTVKTDEISSTLKDTPRDFATPAATLLDKELLPLPLRRYFRLVDTALPDAVHNRFLMGGVELKAEKGGKRVIGAEVELDQKMLSALRSRKQLQILVENPNEMLAKPDQMLAQLKPVLARLTRDQGANAAFAIATKYVNEGQWILAQEVFLTLVDEYPTHPLAVEAYRWLVQHNTSSEAQRRFELGQFLLVGHTEVELPKLPTPKELKKFYRKKKSSEETQNDSGGNPFSQEPTKLPFTSAKALKNSQITYLSNKNQMRHWLKGSVEFGKRLQQLGAMYTRDPAIQFCLQSAHRHLGEHKKTLEWYKEYMNLALPGPWQKAAAAESWLAFRSGQPPKEVMECRLAASRPFLDGQFDDACWQNLKPTILQNAQSDTIKAFRTEVRLAFDQDFLYLALRCTHPPEYHVPAVKVRKRDENLLPYDRVSLMLDLDRDYSTYFHFQVDQRGCVFEECWGDKSWNPRWFVAVRSEQTEWNIEAAIPIGQMTGNNITLGSAWACNVVRILPQRGVQAFSVPAGVEPRPEGMGLLLFQDDPAQRFVRPTSQQAPSPNP